MNDERTYLRYFRVTVPSNGHNAAAVEHAANERVVPMNMEYVKDVGIVVCGLIVTEPRR